MTGTRLLRLLALVAGLAAVVVGAVWATAPARRLARVEAVAIGATPATVFLPRGPERGPAIVIAHGFAASQQIMRSFALALAQGGYRVVTFDFPGHGRSGEPLAGGLEDGEARNAQLATALDIVVRYAEARFGGPVGLVGHSMGSEAVARYAEAHPEIAATVGVSLVYAGVTPAGPRNLLVLTGVWEPGLIPIAQAVVDSAASGTGVAGVTYGSFADGTARRVVLVPWAEHVAVLFSGVSLAEAYDWFRAAMPPEGGETWTAAGGVGYGVVGSRLPALGLLFVGSVLLFWPLAGLIQPIAPLLGPPVALGRRAWWVVALAPALLTPPLLILAPARSPLPIAVGGPLALFFGIYGLFTLTGLAVAVGLARRVGRAQTPQAGGRVRDRVLPAVGVWRRGVLMSAAVAMLVVGYVFLAFGLPAQLELLNYFPPAPRLPVFLAVFAAMLPYFLGDEALTRRPGAPRGAYAITKVLFLLALAAAILLSPDALAFLVLIAPLFVVYFAVYGLFSGVVWRRTGSVLPGALANSVIFAWIVAATFPLVG
jgi:pimeloyl-ACP methyl ester carboxylesterase